VSVARRCETATGLDASGKMLEVARRRVAAASLGNVDLILGSATELPFEDEHFDVVHSFSTLVLVDAPDKAVSEIARVTRPGGIALLDLAGKRNLQQRHWRRWYATQGVHTWSALSLATVKRLLGASGLEPIELHALGVSDQWKYVRFLNRATYLDRVFHRQRDGRDLDYRLSNLPVVRAFANRWYVVARKADLPHG
jgi:SAM-dependent methyltransferase